MVIADGEYDCLIVDARREEDGVHIELAITSGPSKGDIVRVRASQVERDALDLLALPVRLVVRGGMPKVSFDA